MRFQLILLLLLLCNGCVEKKSIPPIEDWITFHAPEQIYSVLMPNQPQVQKKNIGDNEITLHIAGTRDDTFAVTVCCHVLPAGSDSFDLENRSERKLVLDGCLDGLKNLSGCQVIEQHDGFADSSYPMREFFGKLTKGKNTALVRGRYIMTPRALIEVITVGDEKQIQQPQILKCLNSVKIKAQHVANPNDLE